MSSEHTVRFSLGGLLFEYDYEQSIDEDRYNTIGDASAGGVTVIGTLKGKSQLYDILFVVYTERETASKDGKPIEVTRLDLSQTRDKL